MQCRKATFSNLFEGSNNRYYIPIYQRDYAWKSIDCEQLYEDLKRIDLENGNDLHFFGSVVAQERNNGNVTEYHIIDGQQRITTVTLLLLAIGYMVNSTEGNVTSETKNLTNQILNRFIIDHYNNDDIKLKLKRNDREALKQLITHTRQPDLELSLDEKSKLTINFKYFCNQIRKDSISVDALYHAIQRLEFMLLTLDNNDHAQLIFESLNTTGRRLTDGDIVRNFVLMSAPPNEVNEIQNYVDIWEQIEHIVKANRNNDNDLSDFIRHYLCVKHQNKIEKKYVYLKFKSYFIDQVQKRSLEDLLRDMHYYAVIYRDIVTCQSECKNGELDEILNRLQHLKTETIIPFLMEVLNLKRRNELSDNDVINICLTIENYLFRRAICDGVTKSYTSIFASLHRKICDYDGTTNRYVDKLIYHLKNMQDNKYRFPGDEEFSSALNNENYSNQNISTFQYILERFEKSYNPRESLNIYEGLDRKSFSIEHIMPQNLSPDWRRELGENANIIHESWLHKLGNLTLTAYNQSMSNRTFLEKRNMENGFANSGFSMNRELAQLDRWGEAEIENRHNRMVTRAVEEIWRMPETKYHPLQQEASEQSTPHRRCRNRRNKGLKP